ncbi:MAG: hypothetical protein ABFD90_12280 [Phycisphaerales bacterium]
MDERQIHNEASARHPQGMSPMNRMQPYGFQMAGGREHSVLVVEGHYRCPHCRRLDTAETSDTTLSRR